MFQTLHTVSDSAHKLRTVSISHIQWTLRLHSSGIWCPCFVHKYQNCRNGGRKFFQNIRMCLSNHVVTCCSKLKMETAGSSEALPHYCLHVILNLQALKVFSSVCFHKIITNAVFVMLTATISMWNWTQARSKLCQLGPSDVPCGPWSRWLCAWRNNWHLCHCP